jgi:hypothetical protein
MQQQLSTPLPPLPAELALGTARPALDALLRRATAKASAERFADAGALAAALAPIVARAQSPGAPAESSGPPLSPPHAPTRPPERRPTPLPAGLVARALRAGAVLVSLLSLLGIVLLGGLIYLLRTPDGDTYRTLLRSALPDLLDDDKEH